jgi:hypothetical protein
MAPRDGEHRRRDTGRSPEQYCAGGPVQAGRARPFRHGADRSGRPARLSRWRSAVAVEGLGEVVGDLVGVAALDLVALQHEHHLAVLEAARWRARRAGSRGSSSRARAVASTSWPANTVTARSGRVSCRSAIATAGRALRAAQPQTEFTTTSVVDPRRRGECLVHLLGGTQLLDPQPGQLLAHRAAATSLDMASSCLLPDRVIEASARSGRRPGGPAPSRPAEPVSRRRRPRADRPMGYPVCRPPVRKPGQREEVVREAVQVHDGALVDARLVRERDRAPLRAAADGAREVQPRGGLGAAREDEVLQRLQLLLRLVDPALQLRRCAPGSSAGCAALPAAVLRRRRRQVGADREQVGLDGAQPLGESRMPVGSMRARRGRAPS